MSTLRPVLLPLLSVLLVLPSAAGAQRRPVTRRRVAQRCRHLERGHPHGGDLYRPAQADDERLPAIIMSHGWGGTKAGLARNAIRFAAGRVRGARVRLPRLGRERRQAGRHRRHAGAGHQRRGAGLAREIRRVVDPIDQTLDIRRAFDFLEGEPNVDIERIGYWGSSYSGAHAIWVAANEPRAACAVGQVAAADSLDLARTSWKDTGIDIEQYARQQAIRRPVARSHRCRRVPTRLPT